MVDVYTGTILFVITFLLICWVVTEFQIYNDTHSMSDELKKPRMVSRITVGQIRFWDAVDSIRGIRDGRLREANKSTYFFGKKKREKKKESRMAERISQRQ